MEIKGIENNYIYDYIKDYLNEISVINYKKGQYIAHSNDNLGVIFFVLEGNIKVECISKYGKSLLVDELSKNEFVGKISYMFGQDLYCDVTAASSATLLKINRNTFKKLENNSEFLNFFLYKTSKRIYSIYKKLIMKDLFRLEEILAYYIIKSSENGVFKFKSMNHLSVKLSVSRKNLYNTINKFIDNNYIVRDKNSFIILDRDYLYKLSIGVTEAYADDFKIDL